MVVSGSCMGAGELNSVLMLVWCVVCNMCVGVQLWLCVLRFLPLRVSRCRSAPHWKEEAESSQVGSECGGWGGERSLFKDLLRASSLRQS